MSSLADEGMDPRVPLSADRVDFLERVLSRENNDCVAMRQAFHDWENSLTELAQKDGECSCELANMPGMPSRLAVKVRLTKAWLGSPSTVSLSGDIDSSLTPQKCREMNLTYASPLYVSFVVETEEPSSSGTSYKTTECAKAYLGTVPVMVDLDRHPSPEIAIDRGGYFLSSGKEKCIPFFRETDCNSPVCYRSEDDGSRTNLSVRSGAENGKISSTRVTHDTEAGVKVWFKGAKRAQSALEVFQSLGQVPDAQQIFTDEELSFFGEQLLRSEDAAEDVAEDTAEDTAEDAAHNVVDDEASPLRLDGLFPGTASHLKAAALVSSLRMLAFMRDHFLTERDSLQTQTLRGCKEILTEVFQRGVRATMTKLRQNLSSRLLKLYKLRDRNKRSRALMPDAASVKKFLMRFNNVCPRLHYFIATGNLQSNDRSSARALSGACQLLERTSRLQTQTFFRKVVTSLDSNSAPPSVRDYRLDSLGVLDPVSTPEGKRTGLVNILSNQASLSRSQTRAVPAILDMIACHLYDGSRVMNEVTTGVWVSGRFVGSTTRPADVARIVRMARRSGNLPRDVGVSVYPAFLEIRVHGGRPLRPFFPLDIPYFDTRRDTTWSSLIQSGHLCTVDLREVSGMLVARHDETAQPHHSYRELPPSCSLGPVTSTIPFLDMEPAPRASYQGSMAQQSIGFPEKYYTPGRWDTKDFGMYYAQKPLVSTSYERNSGAHDCPVGANVVVAIMPDNNQEDALVWNLDSLERGLMMATQWKTKTFQTGDRYLKWFAHPDPENPCQPAHLAHLDPLTGIAKIGSVVRKGYALCGIGSSKGVTVMKYEGALPAVVEDVIVFDDNDDGSRKCKMKLRIPHPVLEGDKFASRFSQKGVVSAMKRRHELPFDENGGTVDLFVHPAFMPSRMTVGQMAEHLCSFAGTFLGFMDATAFAHSTISLLKSLETKGFKKRSNRRRFRCPVTGRSLGFFEVGIPLYNRLNKLASEKARCRTWGARHITTNQPMAGKEESRKALRAGIMEFQAFMEGGAPKVQDDANITRSDAATLLVCACGNAHVHGKSKVCPACGQAGRIKEVQSTTAFIRLWQICESMQVGLHFDV